MAKLLFTLTAPLFKQFFTDRRGNRHADVCEPDKAEVATLYSKLPADYTKASDATKDAIKTAFLQLATKHADKCGKCKFVDKDSIFLSANGIGVSFYATQRVVLDSVEIDIPD